jgi:esterase/lipase
MFETLRTEEKIAGAIVIGGLAILAFVKPARKAVGLSDNFAKKTPRQKLTEIGKLYSKIDNGIYERYEEEYEDDEDGEETFMTDELYEEMAKYEFSDEIKELKKKINQIKPSEIKNNKQLLKDFRSYENLITKLPTIY